MLCVVPKSLVACVGVRCEHNLSRAPRRITTCDGTNDGLPPFSHTSGGRADSEAACDGSDLNPSPVRDAVYCLLLDTGSWQ